MPDVVHGYCSVDDLREQFADRLNPQLSENLLVRAINAASRAVDDYTGRQFWTDVTPTTREYTPRHMYGMRHITHPSYYGDHRLPVGDITTTVGLVIATDDTGDGSYTGVWAPADYQLTLSMAGRYPSGPWNVIESFGTRRFDVYGASPVVRRVRVTAKFGWPDIPAEVELATVLKAASYFKRKDAPFGVIQFGDQTALRIGRTDGDVVGLLADFIRDVAMVG